MRYRASVITLTLLGLCNLSGCAALVIGGAAAGGYVVGKDERSPAQILDDGTITGSIKTRLAADKYVKALWIDVDTYNGVVTLHGIVRSYIEHSQAEAIAKDVTGVRSVVNKIKVETSQTQ